MANTGPYSEDEARRTLTGEYALAPLDPPKNLHNGQGGGAHQQGDTDGGSAGGGANGNANSSSGQTPPTDPYEQSDSGNARRLLDTHGANMRYVVDADKWHVWTGNAWEEDVNAHQAQSWARDCALTLWGKIGQPGIPRTQMSDMAKWALDCNNIGRIRSTVANAALDADVTMHVRDFDTHPWLLPCANGLTYDLTTGALRASRRDDYLTASLPVAASAVPMPHPEWDAFLSLIMGGDAEMVAYLRLTLGIVLTGSMREQAFWLWFGDRDNGKTTLLRFMARFLGAYAYKIPLRALLEKRDVGGIRHDLADMRGKRLAYSEEFKPGNVLDEGTVKDMTGGGDITADRKGENNITFPSTAKLIIATNTLPELRDVGPALRKRIRCIPFPVNLPKWCQEHKLPLKDQDAVIASLMAEAPGILQDLVAAVVAWRATDGRLALPAKVRALTDQYLVEQDPLVPWMETCCVSGGDTEERAFNDWYVSFLEQSGRTERTATPHWFGRQLRAKGFTKRETATGPQYTGPKLTDPAKSALTRALERRAGEEFENRLAGKRGRVF